MQLSRDLMREFPGMKGFSQTNLYRMRAFYLAFQSQPEFFPQLVGKIPWGHIQVIIEKLKTHPAREWYIRKTIEYGWSRAVLIYQIETRLYERQAVADKTTNFALTLPPPQSDLAQEMIKDEYIFDFLTLRDDAHEREVERALVDKIRDFLLELGSGFAYIGNQYHLEVGEQDFYLDLLFYHLDLRAFIVIDLKVKEFQPEDAGKMNFYLSAVDDKLRRPEDQPSIGIILCKGRNRTIVEYALRDLYKPVGVSDYRYRTELPDELAKSLPSPDEFERMLSEAEESL
jgi:predicted nuclease of restriction endonuclease-like (RecB) superfamily